ncbi:MAG: 50S ribosomal protein L24 [Candidatus Ornithospirochaeta sp.]|nr:50S ribosomal protein L24 [Sphaerochaetaceae bacterium]MDY5524542.1 50S ribosomal protein L24 [Candidatus Ornithospirochaeta sp.]
MRLKKDDTVKIIAGKDKGLTGKIVKVDPVKERVIVQGANMVKKTMKKQNAQDKGGIVEVEAPIHVSNVALVSKGSVSKIGYKMENGKKVRYAKKTGEVL